MRVFGYDDSILERYPEITGGMILARGVTNGPTLAALLDRYRAEQQEVLARVGDTPLSQIESLAGWRRAFRGFGVDPTQYRCAAEALLRRLTKKGDIPTINLLVDAGNLVSIRYALPIAVVDRRAPNGSITVCFAKGTERFGELGEREPVHPEPGEVIFADETGQAIARRWCWRQSESSAATDSTRDCLITIEGHHAAARADIESAIADLLGLLDEFAGGNYVSDVLDRNHPWLVEVEGEADSIRAGQATSTDDAGCRLRATFNRPEPAAFGISNQCLQIGPKLGDSVVTFSAGVTL